MGRSLGTRFVRQSEKTTIGSPYVYDVATPTSASDLNDDLH